MSAEDEEVVKLLLYGNEAQGLTGEWGVGNEQGLCALTNTRGCNSCVSVCMCVVGVQRGGCAEGGGLYLCQHCLALPSDTGTAADEIR